MTAAPEVSQCQHTCWRRSAAADSTDSIARRTVSIMSTRDRRSTGVSAVRRE
jgi:hypothetical protein